MRIGVSAKVDWARFLAKAPMPMIHSGCRMLMILRKWASQEASSFLRAGVAGSLSGVRLRPDVSRKAKGQ